MLLPYEVLLMSSSQRKIIWEPENGSVFLDGTDGKDRVILTRRGFMAAFFDEIELVGGKDTLTMVFRAMLTKLGAPAALLDRPTTDDVNEFHDGLILPYVPVDGNAPAAFTPMAGKRELVAYGDTVFVVQTVRLLQKLKEAMVDILTERGAVAILRRVAKRGGFAVAEKALTDYQWKELDGALASMDAVLGSVFPLYGWGLSRTIVGRAKDNRRVFFLKCWNIYEAEGITSQRPLCIIHQSYLEGIGECLSQTYEKLPVESREVKCRANGDGYCGFFIVQKQKDEKGIDWKQLEGDAERLDAALPTSIG
jgi:predicted hydrocarbon binding protein